MTNDELIVSDAGAPRSLQPRFWIVAHREAQQGGIESSPSAPSGWPPHACSDVARASATLASPDAGAANDHDHGR